MKQSFLILTGLAMFVVFGAGTVGAADFEQRVVENSKARPVGRKLVREKALKEETLRPGNADFVLSRINTLERRISQLEEEIRFLEERTRNLDRRVDDLRQRH